MLKGPSTQDSKTSLDVFTVHSNVFLESHWLKALLLCVCLLCEINFTSKIIIASSLLYIVNVLSKRPDFGDIFSFYFLDKSEILSNTLCYSDAGEISAKRGWP